MAKIMEIGGYAARIYSHKRPFVIGAFVAQYFLVVVVCLVQAPIPVPASTPKFKD